MISKKNVLTSDVIDDLWKGIITLTEACDILRIRGHAERTIEAVREEAARK